MRKTSLSPLVIIIISVLIVGFFYKRYHVPPSIDLPAIALTDLNGKPVSTQSYAGHPLMIDFFATWCGPCLRELPELIDLKKALADKNLQVICISDEPIEKLERIQTLLGKQLIILHADHNLHDWGIYTVPTNYIFDAQGKKIYQKVNPDDWTDSTLVEHIRTLLD